MFMNTISYPYTRLIIQSPDLLNDSKNQKYKPNISKLLNKIDRCQQNYLKSSICELSKSTNLKNGPKRAFQKMLEAQTFGFLFFLGKNLSFPFNRLHSILNCLKINSPQITFKSFSTPLHAVISHQRNDLLVKILKNTPAHLLAEWINASDDQEDTPLYLAVRTFNLKAVCLLVQHANLINQNSVKGDTPLYLALNQACVEKDLSIVKKASKMALLIIKKRLWINHWSTLTNHPLHLAAYLGNKHIIQALIQAGADRLSVDEGLCTPRLFALCLSSSLPVLNLFSTKEEIALTNWLFDLKLLVHRFGLDFEMPHPKGNLATVHGFYPAPSFRQLFFYAMSSSFQEFVYYPNLQTLFPPNWTRSDSQDVFNLFQNIYHVENYQEDMVKILHQNHQIIVVDTGWTGHSAGLVILDHFLMKCNRGDGCGDFPGVRIYRMHQPEKLSSTLKLLLDHYYTNDGQDIFVNQLDEQLGLEEMYYLKHAGQPAQVCAWDSLKTVMHAILFAKLIQKGLSVDEAKKTSYEFYKAWVLFDRYQALEKILYQAPHSHLNQYSELYYSILWHVFKKTFNDKYESLYSLFTQSSFPDNWLNAQDGYTGNTLLIEAARQGKTKIVQDLVKLGASLHIPNDKQELPLDVAKQGKHTEIIEYLAAIPSHKNV